MEGMISSARPSEGSRALVDDAATGARRATIIYRNPGTALSRAKRPSAIRSGFLQRRFAISAELCHSETRGVNGLVFHRWGRKH
jgi:hypothetical protein